MGLAENQKQTSNLKFVSAMFTSRGLSCAILTGSSGRNGRSRRRWPGLLSSTTGYAFVLPTWPTPLDWLAVVVSPARGGGGGGGGEGGGDLRVFGVGGWVKGGRGVGEKFGELGLYELG